MKRNNSHTLCVKNTGERREDEIKEVCAQVE